MGRKYHENTSLEKFGLSVIISDKVGFSKNNMTRDIVRCFIMTEGSIHLKDTIILDPSPRSSKCRKQKLTEQKGEIDKSTDFFVIKKWIHVYVWLRSFLAHLSQHVN